MCRVCYVERMESSRSPALAARASAYYVSDARPSVVCVRVLLCVYGCTSSVGLERSRGFSIALEVHTVNDK